MAAKKKFSMESIRGVMSMGREAEESMEEHFHIGVYVDPASAQWLVEAVRDALVPERDALVDVHKLGAMPTVVGIDLGIVISGGSDEPVRRTVRGFAGARQHVLVVAESSLDVPDFSLPTKLSQYVSDAVATDRNALYDRMANAMLDATEKDVSCAANFKFCRDVATARLVSKCAARNAFMGVANFIPGAGMPLMTMNQVNLSFDIAATYGHGLSIGRIPEVFIVIFAGFAYRGAARLLLNALPALSLVIRAGMAYGGTLVTGRMLASHFTETLPSPDPPVTVEAQVEEPQEVEDVPEARPARTYITIGEGGALA